MTYVVLPGPPSELKPMVLNQTSTQVDDREQAIFPSSSFLWNWRKSVGYDLSDLIDNQTDPTLAPYAKTGEVTLRLSTKASSQEEANQALDI